MMNTQAGARAVRCTTALAALVAAASCGDSKSPWARKMTKAERLAWPTKCGIPAELVVVLDGPGGQGSYADTSYGGKFVEPKPSARVFECDMSWNRDKDRLANLRVHLGRSDPPLTATDIEPLLNLVLAELRPEDHAEVRNIAMREEHTRQSFGKFEIEGGFSLEHRSWNLAIMAR